MAFEFPAGFRFGAASSSYQVEGAARADGRGESIWDEFCRRPGAIRNGESGEVSCDHYHRFRDDVKLMADLGLQAYRFSIAWPRVVPDGDGAVNPAGLDFYRRLCETLLEHGIAPCATLYHWDLPLSLEQRFGGWRDRRTPEAFGRYAAVTVRALGDLVRCWMPLNEMPATIVAGYREGFHAPGARETPAVVNRVQHHCLLAHGLGVAAVREHGRGAEVGTAHNARVYVPVFETPEHIEATRKAFRFANGPMLEPMTAGAYPADWLARQGADAPVFTDADMAVISAPCDFIGLNVYRGIYVEAPGSGRVDTLNVGAVENVPLPVAGTPTTAGAATEADGFVELPFPSTYPRGAAEWVLFVPQAVYWGVRLLHECYGYRKLYITENGTVGEDLPRHGRIIDTDRLQYYRLYLQSAARAVAEGYPLQGYFAWSILDNFEWSDGYANRFGIVHVDYATQKRTPKLSARFYAACARAGRVL